MITAKRPAPLTDRPNGRHSVGERLINALGCVETAV